MEGRERRDADERQERERWSKWCSNYFVSPLFQICTFGASFVICGMAACRHTCFRQVGTSTKRRASPPLVAGGEVKQPPT